MITIIRGDTVTIQATFTDEDSAAIDLTGATVFFTVKPVVDNDSDDSDATITKDQTTHVDATNGETSIQLTSTETDVTPLNYTYDFQIKTAAGAILSVERDTFQVLGDVTRRTS